jgi:hypothetical protein
MVRNGAGTMVTSSPADRSGTIISMSASSNSSATPQTRAEGVEPDVIGGFLHAAFGSFLAIVIELLVRLTGRRIRRTVAPWLSCFLGEPGRIGAGIYQRIAEAEHLELRVPASAGLVPNFESLRGSSFDPDLVHPRIRHFYEHAASYHLEVWSEAYLVGRFFLWLLVEFLSTHMDQLNFPISSLEVAKGMSSEIVQLVDSKSGQLRYTGWLRRLKSSGRVIYAGIYSMTNVPNEDNPCVKVTFPCRGSANVYLRPVAHGDGSFGLESTGSAFGRSGFYRIVKSGPDHWRVRNFKTLHEVFHVYVDSEGVLRCDHKISFVGLTILRLHYKMTLASDLECKQGAAGSI